MPKPTTAPAPAPVKPVVAQKPASGMTDTVQGLDMDSMVAQATEAAQNTHNTQVNQAVSKVEAVTVAPAKAAVIPTPAAP